jgi:hypothetical protein
MKWLNSSAGTLRVTRDFWRSSLWRGWSLVRALILIRSRKIFSSCALSSWHCAVVDFYASSGTVIYLLVLAIGFVDGLESGILLSPLEDLASGNQHGDVYLRQFFNEIDDVMRLNLALSIIDALGNQAPTLLLIFL